MGSRCSDCFKERSDPQANSVPNTTTLSEEKPVDQCDDLRRMRTSIKRDLSDFACFQRTLTVRGGRETVMHGKGGIIVENGTYLAHQFVNSVDPPYTAVPATWIEKGTDELSANGGRGECGAGTNML